jgi:S1-C subfamily serine protease
MFRKNGEVAHGWLGVSLDVISPELAAQLEVPSAGAIVKWIFPHSPARRAGLQIEDVITRWNGESIGDPTELTHLVVATPVGSEVKLSYIREGRERTATVTVAKRPPQAELLRRQ